MYAEYYAGNASEDWELSITFYPTEDWAYTAYITGLPVFYWDEKRQAWEQQVRPEVPRE